MLYIITFTYAPFKGREILINYPDTVILQHEILNAKPKLIASFLKGFRVGLGSYVWCMLRDHCNPLYINCLNMNTFDPHDTYKIAMQEMNVYMHVCMYIPYSRKYWKILI